MSKSSSKNHSTSSKGEASDATRSITDRLSRLQVEIAGNRKVYTTSKDALLNAHVDGRGFILLPDGEKDTPNFDDSYDEQVDEHESEEENASEDEEERYFDKVMEYLDSLGPEIKNLHRTPRSLHDVSCPNLVIKPKDYQLSAFAKMKHITTTKAKAMILADPMGLGKTLPALMALAWAITVAKRFSIVVVPPSCAAQWVTEVDKFFEKGTIKVLNLNDPNVSPFELMKYDVVVVSYHFVMSQYRKLIRYLENVEEYKNKGEGKIPVRPNLSIFSDLFFNEHTVLSPFLVLDEVNAIKNSRSKTFRAIMLLRDLADVCLMLTGSVVDNTWMDLFAFLQLNKAHNIRTRAQMRAIFASENSVGKLVGPRSTQLKRLVQLLNTFVIRRPEDTIDIPPLHESTVNFKLSGEEEWKSNEAFLKYEIVMNIRSSSGENGDEEALPWKHLTRSMQYAMHPSLVGIMHLIKNPLADDDDLTNADIIYEAEDIVKWTEWKESLKEDENWRSSRITALIDQFNKSRDLDPDCSVLIFDESVYFLDIVQIALSQMYDPVECLRYDGREVPEKRSKILQEFEEAKGGKILLISRAAGGVGLNITSANVVILCSPWWKRELEMQAMKRAHRTGQTREVYAYRLVAKNCSLDAYKAKLRDRKHKHNQKIVDAITRKDGEIPKVYSDFS